MLKKCNVCGEISEHKSWKAYTCNKCLDAGYKWCPSCETVQPISNFHKNGNTLRSFCKECECARCVKTRGTDTKRLVLENDEARRLHRNEYSREYKRNKRKDDEYRKFDNARSLRYKTNKYQTDDAFRRSEAERSRRWNYVKYHTNEEFRRKKILKVQCRDAPGSLTASQWQGTCKAFDYQCAYCGTVTNLTMDHVVPIKAGGITNVENIIPACQHCNSSKGANDVVEWYTSQPFYSKKRLESIMRYLEHMKGGDAK